MGKGKNVGGRGRPGKVRARVEKGRVGKKVLEGKNVTVLDDKVGGRMGVWKDENGDWRVLIGQRQNGNRWENENVMVIDDWGNSGQGDWMEVDSEKEVKGGSSEDRGVEIKIEGVKEGDKRKGVEKEREESKEKGLGESMLRVEKREGEYELRRKGKEFKIWEDVEEISDEMAEDSLEIWKEKRLQKEKREKEERKKREKEGVVTRGRERGLNREGSLKLMRDVNKFMKRVDDMVYVTGRKREEIGVYWMDVCVRKLNV